MRKAVYVHCINCGEAGCVVVEMNEGDEGILDLGAALDDSHVAIEVEDLGPANK